MKHKKLIITWMACASVCMNLSAQDADFDLSSQRSEAQDVLAVPGKKLDHQGIIINPMPHQLQSNHISSCFPEDIQYRLAI